MSKSLKTIQTLAKIGRAISKIIFIVFIVSAVLCIAGIVSVAMGADNSAELGKVTVHGLIDGIDGINIGRAYDVLAQLLVFVISGAVLAKFTEVYFRNELKAGTPFTFEGAEEMRRLGILGIAIPLAASIAGAIIAAVTASQMGVEKHQINNGAGITLGLLFLVLSVIFRHGAEISQAAEQKASEFENM